MDFISNSGFSMLSCFNYVADTLNLSMCQLCPRIAMWVVLNECPDACNLIGPDCSSWGVPARASSMRSFINPLGRMANLWVSSNTCLVSRPLVYY